MASVLLPKPASRTTATKSDNLTNASCVADPILVVESLTKIALLSRLLATCTGATARDHTAVTKLLQLTKHGIRFRVNQRGAEVGAANLPNLK
jgi:hypothetical protein